MSGRGRCWQCINVSRGAMGADALLRSLLPSCCALYCRAALRGEVGVVARPAYSVLGGRMAPLEVVEIRTLDGANIFLPEPAIKVQVRIGALSGTQVVAAQARCEQILATIAAPDDGLDTG